MKHKVKVTVLDTKLYPKYQQQYCANPCSGKCPVYNKGDEFMFYRDDKHDDFWHCGLDTLVKTEGSPDEIAGVPKKPFCSEIPCFESLTQIINVHDDHRSLF